MSGVPIVCSDPGCAVCPPDRKIVNWSMYDAPLTMSVSAPNAAAARAYVEQWLASDKCTLYGQDDPNEPAYKNDHIFLDGDVRECDCMGH